MKQGLSYIAQRTGQLRYSTLTTEENRDGVIQNDSNEQWLQPISIYYAAEPIKRGQPVSVASYEELTEEQRKDALPYVVLSNTLVHTKCIGLSQESAEVGQALHILPFGKFKYDITKDETEEYNPFSDLIKNDKENAYKQLIGKPVFVKSHDFDEFMIGDTGNNSDITNKDREIKGELTVLESETYYGNRNVIQVGFISDAPLNDDELNEFTIAIEVQPEGDGRGPVDNTQYELILGEDINVSSKGQILALALGKETNSNFEFTLNFSPLKEDVNFAKNDFIAIQKFDGETAFVTFDDTVTSFEDIRKYVNKDNNTNDNAFINIAGEYLEAARKYYAKDGKDYENVVNVVSITDFNMFSRPEMVKNNVKTIIEALNKGFKAISVNATLAYDDFDIHEGYYGPEDGKVVTGGSVTLKSASFGGYYDLYISESLRAKLFEGSTTKNRGSFLNEGKAVIADVRIPARQNVIGLYYNRDYDRPIKAGANILVMYQGAFDKVGDINGLSLFETGKEYFLGFRGAICLAGENKWYETMRIGSAQTPTRLIVDCGNGIKRFYGDVPCGYIKPTANNVEDFGYLLMDGGETLPKDVKQVTDKDGNILKPHRYESARYPDLFSRLKTWYSPYEMNIIPSCTVTYNAGTYLPIDIDTFSPTGKYFIYTNGGFEEVETPVQNDAYDYFRYIEDEESIELGETFVAPKVVSFKNGSTENYCQIKWLPESCDSVVPEIPYLREYGFFGADDGGHYQPVIKPLDVDSLIHIGYFSEEINEDMLDIHLFVDLNNNEENADWVEVLPGFHLFNNTTSYGYRWKIERVYEDDTARCRFILKTDLNTGYVRDDESQSVGIAYVIDPHRPPQILFGYRYKVVVRRYSERQREWNLGAALTASVKDHVIDPITNTPTPYPVSGIAVESFINRVSEYNNLSVIDQLTIGGTTPATSVTAKALSFNVASNDVVFSSRDGRTKTNIENGVLKVGSGNETETLKEIKSGSNVLNSAQVISLFTTDWKGTKIFNTYNDGGKAADKDGTIDQINAGLLRGMKPSKVVSDASSDYIPYIDTDGNFEVGSSITNIISDKETIKTGYTINAEDVSTLSGEKPITVSVPSSDYSKLEEGREYTVSYTDGNGDSVQILHRYAKDEDITKLEELKYEVHDTTEHTLEKAKIVTVYTVGNYEDKVHKTSKIKKLFNDWKSGYVNSNGDLVADPEGNEACEYYDGEESLFIETEDSLAEVPKNVGIIIKVNDSDYYYFETSTTESTIKGVIGDIGEIENYRDSAAFETATNTLKEENWLDEDGNKAEIILNGTNKVEELEPASKTEELKDGYLYYIDGNQIALEEGKTTLEDYIQVSISYDYYNIASITYTGFEPIYETKPHSFVTETKQVDGITEENKLFVTKYDFTSSQVELLFGSTPATLKVGTFSTTSSIKYKQVYATDGKPVNGYENKYEDATSTFTNIKVRTSDEDISYDGTTSSDFNSGMTRFSALQALHEVPLSLWSYNEDEEWMKRYFSIVIEQLSEHKESGIVGHDIYASPNGDRTECKDNGYDYTDDEKDSIKTFLSLITDTQEQGMNVISSIGILFKAAKETQARLLELEYSAFGRDAKSLPGDKTDIKKAIECREEGLYDSDDTEIKPNKDYYINLKRVETPVAKDIKKYYILEENNSTSSISDDIGGIAIGSDANADIGPFEFDVGGKVKDLEEDLESIGLSKTAISCRGKSFDESETYYEYDSSNESTFYKVQTPEIDDIKKYYESHIPYKEITQAPMYIGLNRIVRAMCHEIYNNYDPYTIGDIFHNQEPVSRIDELYKLIYGDQDTDSTQDELRLIRNAKTYPNVVSDVSTDSQHENFSTTDANADWYNEDIREACDNTTNHDGTKERLVSAQDLNEEDFSSVVNAVNRIVLKLNTLTAEVNGTDNIKSGPVRLNALRDNVKHLLDHLYFTADGAYDGDPNAFDDEIITADCSHTRKSRLEKLEDLLFARKYDNPTYKVYSQYHNHNSDDTFGAPFENNNYSSGSEKFYTSIIDILERTIGKDIIPLNDANAEWFNIQDNKKSYINGYDKDGKQKGELSKFYTYDINFRRTKDVDERLKNIERLLDETIDSLTATRDVERKSKFVEINETEADNLKNGKFIPYTVWSNTKVNKVTSLTQDYFDEHKDELYVKHNFTLDKATEYDYNAEYFTLEKISDQQVQAIINQDEVNDNFVQVDFYCEDVSFFYREDFDDYSDDLYHMHNDINFTEGTKIILDTIEFIQKLVGINFVKKDTGDGYDIEYTDSDLTIDVFKDNIVKNLSDFYTETTQTLYRVKHVLGSYYESDRPITDDVHDLLETVYGSNGSRAKVDNYTDGTPADSSDSTEGSHNTNIIDTMAKHEYAVNYKVEYALATGVTEDNYEEFYVKTGDSTYSKATSYTQDGVYYKALGNEIPVLDDSNRDGAAENITLQERNKLFGDVIQSVENSKISRLEVLEKYVSNIMKYLDKTNTDIWFFDDPERKVTLAAEYANLSIAVQLESWN